MLKGPVSLNQAQAADNNEIDMTWWRNTYYCGEIVFAHGVFHLSGDDYKTDTANDKHTTGASKELTADASNESCARETR